MKTGFTTDATGGRKLARIVDEAGDILPAQGPIGVFIHHNTLHAFEDLPFEEAVVRAGDVYGCAPFLSEDRYRAEIARGRIAVADVDAVLEGDVGAGGGETIAGVVSRYELRRRLCLDGIPQVSGTALDWLLEETPALEQARPLWDVCLAAACRCLPIPAAAAASPARHRDRVLDASGVDTDLWVHPLLIRFLGAYLDQGISQWHIPERSGGMYRCFLGTYGGPAARLCGEWAGELGRVISDERNDARDGLASLGHSLRVLGVGGVEQRCFLEKTLLALRGWAGMVRQFEKRPERVPSRVVPATLVDFLAVRMVLERVALAFAARRHLGFSGPLKDLRGSVAVARVPTPDDKERAWQLFNVARLCGLDASTIARMSSGQVGEIERELTGFDAMQRRRVLHLAYERHLRHDFYDALTHHRPHAPATAPVFQAIFCVDEREESIRRHLEEVAPEVETIGAAGFFGVAMHFRGAGDVHAQPSCPASITPQHYVEEVEVNGNQMGAVWRRLRRKGFGHAAARLYFGSRTMFRGIFVMTTLGVFSTIPLVFRVIFPWFGALADKARRRVAQDPETRLRVERADGAPPIGTFRGFSDDEMASIVSQLLSRTGMTRLSPLVLVVGHGSTSLNNPHESAHDCGACGGRRGGANARAFAAMANNPRVREELAVAGLNIDPDTWFVGAERNTCDSSITYFDADLIPGACQALFARARAAMDKAREREAHERCRRFDNVPPWFPAAAALMHVESRSVDLAQPRPEYGHASNAFCFVGRRLRTRGLFLDRRAFLVSYDPVTDEDGQLLANRLASIVPVVAGISLEYYFSTVDSTGYGSGTKLPHNVASLLGVMDGAQSDLRTGLPWQMVEIHEPVRLCLVAECTRDRLARVLDENPALRRLVEGRWMFIACIDPDGDELWELGAGGYTRYRPRGAPPEAAGDSQSWYRGQRDYVKLARLQRAAATDGGR